MMENYNQLWEAVLNRAILDYQSPSKKIQKEAADWLLNDNEDFDFVCEALDMNPKKLRERLMQGGLLQCRVKLN